MAAPQKVLLSWFLEGSGTTGQVLLDASITEQHTLGAEVTSHRVEKGPNVSDHIRALPRSLVLEALVTNHPLDVPGTQADGVTGSVQDISAMVEGKAIKYRAFKFEGSLDRVRTVFGDLADALQTGALFAVTTTLKRYENLAARNLAVQRAVGSGNSLRITIDWQEVIIVETDAVAALPPKTQPKKRGSQTGNQLDPNKKEDEKKISIIQKARSVLGAFK